MLVPCYGKFDIWLWIEGNQKINELISTYNTAFLFAASIFTKKVMMEIGKIGKYCCFKRKLIWVKKFCYCRWFFSACSYFCPNSGVCFKSYIMCVLFYFAKKLLFIYSSQGCLTNNSSFVLLKLSYFIPGGKLIFLETVKYQWNCFSFLFTRKQQKRRCGVTFLIWVYFCVFLSENWDYNNILFWFHLALRHVIGVDKKRFDCKTI